MRTITNTSRIME